MAAEEVVHGPDLGDVSNIQAEDRSNQVNSLTNEQGYPVGDPHPPLPVATAAVPATAATALPAATFLTTGGDDGEVSTVEGTPPRGPGLFSSSRATCSGPPVGSGTVRGVGHSARHNLLSASASRTGGRDVRSVAQGMVGTGSRGRSATCRGTAAGAAKGRAGAARDSAESRLGQAPTAFEVNVAVVGDAVELAGADFESGDEGSEQSADPGRDSSLEDGADELGRSEGTDEFSEASRSCHSDFSGGEDWSRGGDSEYEQSESEYESEDEEPRREGDALANVLASLPTLQAGSWNVPKVLESCQESGSCSEYESSEESESTGESEPPEGREALRGSYAKKPPATKVIDGQLCIMDSWGSWVPHAWAGDSPLRKRTPTALRYRRTPTESYYPPEALVAAAEEPSQEN